MRAGRILSLAIAMGGAATAFPAEPEDLMATIKALKERIQDQERRLVELETRYKGAAASQREEIRRLVEDECSRRRPDQWRVGWKEGLVLESADRDFQLRIGGKVHMDWTWADNNETLAERLDEDFPDGIEFRRLRVYMTGTIYQCVDYKLEVNFDEGDVQLKDAWAALKAVPILQRVQVGHIKEPLSLEELTSGSSLTFLERALPNVLVPDRNDGVMVGGPCFDEMATFTAGLFRDADDYGESTSDGGYQMTVRATASPLYANAGEQVLHVGGGYSLRSPQDMLRYRQRPESHFVPYVVDTGQFDADAVHLLNAETALVLGPFSAQAEYMAALHEAAASGGHGGDPAFHGFYASASYFLTGEHRPYKRSEAVFDRVRPKRNFGQAGGWGAWEVAIRYSYLNLDDSLIHAGRLQDVTIGLNWYLNPNVRLMWNYVRAILSDVQGLDGHEALDIFMMRVQVDF